MLLILAGVSISLIIDNNGIIKRSKDARKQYGEAQANERAYLESISDLIDEATTERVEPENISDWEYTEEDDGTITINKYKGSATTVIIPNCINGIPVKKIESDSYGDAYGKQITSIWDNSICSKNKLGYWYPQETIEEVVVSEGIETIGENAFRYSYGLKYITIPDSVTNIGEYAFCDCTSLTNITIPDSVTNIGDGAFGSCTSLTNITIPDSVTNIGEYAFSGCTSLTNITIPNSVITMENYVFASIPAITVNVPFKEGEKPEGWDANWNDTSIGTGNVTVNYLK